MKELNSWPTYVFEVYDKDLHTLSYLNKIKVQAETYEKAVKEVSQRLTVVCVTEIVKSNI